MRCANCHSNNPPGAKFCNQCATPLPLQCPSCGTENPPGAKFCNECATPLTGRVQSSKLQVQSSQSQPPAPSTQHPAERRQLTVMFCDLVDSTKLSEQLDPEEYGEVVRAYQHTSAAVIERFEGYIAQYLGDGLLVYFGYPQAHEDDAARAVRAGLEITAAIAKVFPSPLVGEGQGEGAVGAARPSPLRVRIGIHTGPVVISEIGSPDRHEQLALGETPNIAARVQGQATPTTVVLSAATYQLVQGLFECQELGSRLLKGISTPLFLYQVVREEAAQSRFEVAVQRGLTPLIGREHEVGLLTERWHRTKQAEGQVVLLGGEPGIGKSRLVQVMREQAENDAALRLEFRCSPYHQNSAFYPIIDHLHRLLQFDQHDSPDKRLGKLEQTLTSYRFPQADTVPLLAVLLSLPHPERYPALNFSPQRQKQKTQEVLIAWLIEEAERQVLYCPWEDVHWADPSTLELLTLLIDQVPTARLYLLLTFRPEFVSQWSTRSHISHLTLSRLGRGQVTQMIERVAGDRSLPTEMLQQIVAKTDGVPLFVEELTKMVVEQNVGAYGNTPLLGIPTSLQDALMARLDRLGSAKEIAQLGATLGREFSHELLQAISPLDEEALQSGLSQLVDAELLYQRGVPPHRQYIFKHALIQDAAYQSLLKSRRQQLHQQIAQVLQERFTEIKETQPELLAHHYTEAGLVEQAIPYWERAGHRAIHRLANAEATTHFTRALDLLTTLPSTPKRAAGELSLLLLRAVPLIATQGYASPAVRNSYERAQELCEQITDTFQLFRALWGMALFYSNAGENRTAGQLMKKCMELAEQQQNPSLLLQAHFFIGALFHWFGELSVARGHLKQAAELYEFERDRSLAFVCGIDPGVATLAYGSLNLWYLGYTDQALKQGYEAMSLAARVNHPLSQCLAQNDVAIVHFLRGEAQLAHQQTIELARFAEEQIFQHYRHLATLFRGITLVEQGSIEEGELLALTASAALRNAGAAGERPFILSFLAEVSRKAGRHEEGLHFVNKGIRVASDGEDLQSEAELYRLKGELMLQQESGEHGAESKKSKESGVRSEEQNTEYPNPNSQIPDPQSEAEACFLKALDISRTQQAKSLELRAAMSLVRLRQGQVQDHATRNMQHASRTTQHATHAKLDEAHRMLSEVYNWFTEGFDTKDLQEAKALLEELKKAKAADGYD